MTTELMYTGSMRRVRAAMTKKMAPKMNRFGSRVNTYGIR